MLVRGDLTFPILASFFLQLQGCNHFGLWQEAVATHFCRHGAEYFSKGCNVAELGPSLCTFLGWKHVDVTRVAQHWADPGCVRWVQTSEALLRNALAESCLHGCCLLANNSVFFWN